MVRYIRKLNVSVTHVNALAAVAFNGNVLKPEKLQKSLFEFCVKKDLDGAAELSIQGSFFATEECSYQVNTFGFL